MNNIIQVEVILTAGCSAAEATAAAVQHVVDELGVSASITTSIVKDQPEAMRIRFLGSPTVRINGRDVEPGAGQRSEFGFG